MKNIFRAFGAQSTSNEQTTEIELGEQDLEHVTGAHGHGGDYEYHHDDDDYEYHHDDDDYEYRHRHHRHHR